MSRGLACCIKPQPGGSGDFWSRFSSSSPWYASIKLQGSSASFGPPRVFYFPGTRHIWWAFPYPPPGEAPDRRLATPHGSTVFNYYIDLLYIHFLLPTFLNSVMKCCYVIFGDENRLHEREIWWFLKDNWKSGLMVQTEIYVTSQTREFLLWYNMP